MVFNSLQILRMKAKYLENSPSLYSGAPAPNFFKKKRKLLYQIVSFRKKAAGLAPSIKPSSTIRPHQAWFIAVSPAISTPSVLKTVLYGAGVCSLCPWSKGIKTAPLFHVWTHDRLNRIENQKVSRKDFCPKDLSQSLCNNTIAIFIT